MKTCNKKQTCNVCQAPFKMKLGCNLEKRCPACRFLKLQAIPKGAEAYQKSGRGFVYNNKFQVRGRDLRLLSESQLVKAFSDLESCRISSYSDKEAKEELVLILVEWLRLAVGEQAKDILCMRFGLGDIADSMDLDEISIKLGISRVEARAIESYAIRTIKENPNLLKPIEIYLDTGYCYFSKNIS